MWPLLRMHRRGGVAVAAALTASLRTLRVRASDGGSRHCAPILSSPHNETKDGGSGGSSSSGDIAREDASTAATTAATSTRTASEAAGVVARPPPSHMPLAYLLESAPSRRRFADCRTDADVWAADDVATAWRRLYAALARAYEAGDVRRAAVLRGRDAAALAHYTAHAETLHLLAQLPPSLRASLIAHPRFAVGEVEEMYMHLGQEVEVRGGAAWLLRLPPPSLAQLQHVCRRLGRVGDDGRACVPQTAHRASVWRGRGGEVLGVTLRVGRYVPNVARALLPLAQRGSVLVVSKAGMGKTTLLRDLAVSLAHTPSPLASGSSDGGGGGVTSSALPPSPPRVTVVDTSNEIGGDGAVPLPFLGRCRRMQVPTRSRQGAVMTEVLQNHTPEYVIVDELATGAEAEAAWSMTQRGVRVLATCHGERLRGLLQNQSLNLLVGGVAQAFLSNEERRLRNKTRKTVLERPHASPFDFVVELHSRTRAFVYADVNRAVDLLLDEQDATREAAGVGAAVDLTQPLPAALVRLLAARDAHALLRDAGGSGDDKLASNDDDGDDGGDNGARRRRRSDDDLLDELCR